MRRRLAQLALALLGSLTVGCSEDLPSGNVITFTQVAGVLLQVAGDPTRSSPAPGEDLDVEVIVAYPAEQKPITWAFLGCVPETTELGIPFCASAPTLLGSQLTPTVGNPTFTMTLPSLDELGGANQLLMIGGVCADGAINIPTTIDPDDLDFSALTVPCENGSMEGVVLTMPIYVQSDTFTNQNPTFLEVTFAGNPWTDVADPAAPSTGCVGSGVWTVSLGDVINGNALTVGFRATEGSREDFVADAGDPPEPTPFTEDLQISHLCTEGEMDRTFSFIEDTSLMTSVDWILPTDPPADGLLARFYFSMRDLRGGYHHLSRALCIVP